ncbi:hypothetical protein B0A48_15757 [Cryoendolithus antarcticus]|uniref:Carboxylesterase type B domain-containing protein n=1 Tax=Cryoendolithus antarcticus TaxID=1507870 RepID=A0A1V8SH74_9PEZI|nr:hypothetical protein B0A48_15757 [Cryoendolithus antarcticus]
MFGESAGGVSVSSILAVPPLPAPFRAAIVQSGTALSNAVGSIGVNAETVWNQTIIAFGCSAVVDQLACMRAVPAQQLQAYATNSSLATTVKNDGITYITNSGHQYSSGKAAKVPVIVGTTANEGTIFTLGETNLTAFVDGIFGFLPSLAAQIEAAYAVGTPGIDSEGDAIAQIFTDVGLQCPSAILARQVTHAGNASWRYIYNATFPNVSKTPHVNLGVYHSSEIPLVFSTYNKTTATAQEYALSNYMRGAWASFARDPASGPGWGATGTFNGTDLGILGLDGSSGVTLVPQTTIDARCSLYELVYSLFD